MKIFDLSWALFVLIPSQFLQIVLACCFGTAWHAVHFRFHRPFHFSRGLRSKFLKSTVNFHSASGRRGFSWEPSREVCIGGYTCRKQGERDCRTTAIHLQRFRASVTVRLDVGFCPLVAFPQILPRRFRKTRGDEQKEVYSVVLKIIFPVMVVQSFLDVSVVSLYTGPPSLLAPRARLADG